MTDNLNKLCLSCKDDCKQFVFATVIKCPDYLHNGIPYKNTVDPVKYLTHPNKNQIKKLITTMCANYSTHYAICLPLDTTCYMLSKATLNSGVCRYFKDSVLPLDMELEEFFTYGTASLKTCSVCRNKFPASGNQKYCSDSCKEIGTREAEKLKKRNQRKKKGVACPDLLAFIPHNERLF